MALGAFAQGFSSAAQAGIDRRERRELSDQLASLQEASLRAGQAGQPQGGWGALAAPPSGGGRGGIRGAVPSSMPISAPTGGSNPFLGLIDRYEGAGNYSTLFGHAQRDGGRFAGTDVSQMTLGQLGEFSSPRGDYGQWVRGQVGRVATPMGRYQIVGTTLRGAAQQLGLSPDTPFNAQTQDTIAMHLARQRLAGATTRAGQRAALRAEWEGLGSVNDRDLDAAIDYLTGST